MQQALGAELQSSSKRTAALVSQSTKMVVAITVSLFLASSKLLHMQMGSLSRDVCAYTEVTCKETKRPYDDRLADHRFVLETPGPIDDRCLARKAF